MDPRILFVVSGAYGDLAQVMSFSHGQPFRERSAVALARELHGANRDSLPMRTYSYSSADEILAAVADWNASVIIMLAAYGFPIEGLTTPAGLRAMVQQLRDRNCHVVTTDPFLGVASAIRTRDMYRMLPRAKTWKQRLMFWKGARKFMKAVTSSAKLLRDVTHLFPMPVDSIANRDRLRRISYYNPELERPHQRQSAEASWLFAISSTDHAIQLRQSGHTEFVNQLLRLFEQTRAAGRRPVLIAPPALIQDMTAATPASLNAELNQFGAYASFEKRLLDAEYAFYWNLFSASAFQMRLPRKLPVFFFDRGHVAHFNKDIYLAAIRSYYGGWEPRQLPQGVLEPKVLAAFWAEQQPAVDTWLQYLKQSPTPSQVIDALAGSRT